MFDIVPIGHATIDIFLGITQAELQKGGSGKEHLCLDFGGKIPVEDFAKSVGGNAPNTAVGFARLGLKVGVITWVGRDPEAEVVLQALKREGVDLFWVTIGAAESTDASVILNYAGERTILAYHFPREYHLPADPPKTKWLYLTSAGGDFSGLHRDSLAYAKSVGAKIAYNPGIHELAAGVVGSEAILRATEVLFLNLEEGRTLAGEVAPVERVFEALGRLGPRVVVLTDGASGSHAFEAGRVCHAEVFPVELVEMTGAGDAFAAGFLAGRLGGESLEECLRWGNANGASVISQVGSQAGLLTKEGLKKNLRAVG